MDGYLVHGAMDLARGSNVRIEDGAGILVYVWEGELWITQEGDQRDYFVTPGRWFRVERNGASLLHAMRRSRVTLTRLYEASRQRRGWLDSLRYRFGFLDKRPSFQ
jgi:hypothetical protein